MRVKNFIYKRVVAVGIVVLLLASACNFFSDLDVPNYNNPDIDYVLGNVHNFPGALSGTYKGWWNTSIGNNPNFALSPASDYTITGYGSWGSAPYYQLPRESVPNPDGVDFVLFPVYGGWMGYYPLTAYPNSIVRKIVEEEVKVEIGGVDYTQSVLAHGYILQGLIHGHLGLLYDKGYIVDENSNLEAYDYSRPATYQDLIDFAVERLEKAIDICESNNFTDGYVMFPEMDAFTNVTLAQFAATTAARFLAYAPRDKAGIASVDWEKVELLAAKGIQSDFQVEAKGEYGTSGIAIDRDNFSYHDTHVWGWHRVSQKIINMMAGDTSPESAQFPFPSGVTELSPVDNCNDSRFFDYMEYVVDPNSGSAAIPWAAQASSRGYHILSHYRYKRLFDSFYPVENRFTIKFMMKSESDLLHAEALIRQGKSGAAALINKTRSIGGLPLATDGDADILDKLFYERYVELLLTYPLLGWFDRRRSDDLQDGTVRHLPMPAQESNLHGLPIYTFGGAGNEQ